MQNLFINNLHNKDVDHFTTDFGLYLRKIGDKPFKKLCNIFTSANIIKNEQPDYLTDEEYYSSLKNEYISPSTYNLKKGKNNIVLERYPKLDKDESYIFVCNHTCPEDIETVLNILDRNTYLVLGSVESLKYNPEMYLSWLNGMIPFDIMDVKQRKELLIKMKRVIKTNSILIFPEGSHNYHPNKIVNNLFDGPVNLALNTNKKIVVVTLVKDNENDVSYIDVSNPVDVNKLNINLEDYYTGIDEDTEKNYVKNLSLYIRDKMATAVYHIIARHFKVINRSEYHDIENYFRNENIQDAFQKLKWKHDVFDAEYLVKKTTEEKEYEDVIKSISNLRLNIKTIKNTHINNRDYILKKLDVKNKEVAAQMRDYWINNIQSSKDSKQLVKKK